MGELDSNEWGGTHGGLPHTDGHHLRFIPLLYHNLGDLSRGKVENLDYFFALAYGIPTIVVALPGLSP